MILNKRIPITYWFNIIKKELLFVTFFSTVIFYLTKYFVDLNIPISIGAFLITAISLLLSFKLSQSYDRWWEARKIWGEIVNDSRSLVLQIKNFSKEGNDSTIERMALRQIAWSYSLSQSLRNKNAIVNLESFISEDEIFAYKNHKNVPLAILDHQSKDLSQLHHKNAINDYQQIQIDNTLIKLCAAMGKAERIKNTAFPKTYRHTLYFFIFITLISLSFSLSEMMSIVEVPFMIIISIPFFLLDKIAENIQDPFENKPNDTAMTSISRTIEINIKQLNYKDIPEPIKPENFYIL